MALTHRLRSTGPRLVSPRSAMAIALAASAYALALGACKPFTAAPPGGEGGSGGDGSGGACPGGGTACDGVCVDLESHPEHCGSCGNACAEVSSSAVCVSGTCQSASCPENRDDCD